MTSNIDFIDRFPQFSSVNDRVRLLVLQGTPYCNLDCSYCYLSKEQRALKSNMPLETVRSTAIYLKNSGLLKEELTILWHAGEPLTAPIEYYESAINILDEELSELVSINYDIQTNAVAINDKWCNFFKERSIRVGVSIDGPKEVHDFYRHTKKGKGSFDVTLKGILKLKENGLPFSTISVITDQSLLDPIGVISFLEELEPVSIGFNIEEIEGANTKSSIKKLDPKMMVFAKTVYSWMDEKGKSNKCREFKTILRSLASAHRPDFRNRQGENKAFSIITVDQNGGVSTFSPELSGLVDPVYGKFTFGNVFGDISDVITNKSFIKCFEDIETGINECESTCNYFRFCSGGSPSNKLMENGSFTSTETQQCWFRRKVFSDVVLDQLIPSTKVNIAHNDSI